MEPVKTYEMNIDPSILELLGPNLYTNIYYILAELIANAYDADAKNVYIIENANSLIVEDDGHGMSYNNREVERYLRVAESSRRSSSESLTRSGNRLKMGRKGVGKLSALSISESVKILTISQGEKSGFILARHPFNGNKLEAIPENEITFRYIKDHGTSIIMTNPEYHLHKTLLAVKKNLVKIFPLVDDNFKIHIIRGKEKEILDSIDKTVSTELCSIITLGDDFKDLGNLIVCDSNEQKEKLVRNIKQFEKKFQFPNTDKPHNLVIKGWIGSYKTARGRKKDIMDFPDNFISLYANKKMGEFNILPFVGQNKMTEVYIVGQLYVDEFEDSDLPDMALSNRQGYKTDDVRYQIVLNYVKNTLLPQALNLRQQYTDFKKKEERNKEWTKNKENEELLKKSVETFKNNAADKICDLLHKNNDDAMKEAISASINETLPDLRLRSKVDSAKKKILISQTSKDKKIADIVYLMLIYNDVPAKDILYSNCEYEESRIPEGKIVYEYLREFFVESYSDKLIYVLFVTSKNLRRSWGTMIEVGAQWITQCEHKVFNVSPYKPEQPLDNATNWCNVYIDKLTGNVTATKTEADKFCSKIEDVCKFLGYGCQNREKNMEHLETLIDISQIP